MEEVREDEKNKLVRLKQLLGGALRQIKKKLSVIEATIVSITSPNDITSETKLLCTIIVEIREVRAVLFIF